MKLSTPNLKMLCLSLTMGGLGFLHSLHAATTAQWGNPYDLGSSGSAIVNSSTTQWMTFTSPETTSVSSVRIDGSTLTGAPVVTVGIYAVDTATGKPTGSALSSTTFTPTATGWQTVNLSQSLTAGTVYAVQFSTPTVGASYGLRFNTTTLGAHTTQPYGTPDSYFGRGGNTSAPFYTQQGVFLLETTSGHPIGQPYTTSTNQNVASLTTSVGERFQFTQPSAGMNIVTGVNLALNIGATQPSNLLTVKLLSSTGSVLTSGTIDLSQQTPNSAAVYTVNFTSSVQLTDTASYYLALYSNGSAANSITWHAGTTDNTALFENATFEGQNAYGVTWNSQSNFSSPTNDLTRDYYFNLNLTQSVPEASTVAMFAIGVGAIVLVRRRLKKI